MKMYNINVGDILSADGYDGDYFLFEVGEIAEPSKIVPTPGSIAVCTRDSKGVRKLNPWNKWNSYFDIRRISRPAPYEVEDYNKLHLI